jgi:hypothetical protein
MIVITLSVVAEHRRGSKRDCRFIVTWKMCLVKPAGDGRGGSTYGLPAGDTRLPRSTAGECEAIFSGDAGQALTGRCEGSRAERSADANGVAQRARDDRERGSSEFCIP